MARQFYLTLPSNSSLEYFPNNTVANFEVKLAEPLELTREWEVELTEIKYPQSWSTKRERNQQTFIYKLGTAFDETGLIPDDHYKSIPGLVRNLNHCMTKEAQTKIKFSYVASRRKVKINVSKFG